MPPSRGPLLGAGMLFIGIALLHAAITVAGPGAYSYFGAPELGAAEARGSPVPDRITWVLVAAFALCAYYAFAGAGRARWRPPLLPLGLVVIGAVFTMRGLFLGPELVALASPGTFGLTPVPPRYPLFSLVSLVTGLATLTGAWRAWPGLLAVTGGKR